MPRPACFEPAIRPLLWIGALLALASGAAGPRLARAADDPPPGRIGVRVQAMTPELREFFEAPPDRGVLVSQVEPGRAAARAGLAVGDVVVAIDGTPVPSPDDFVGRVRGAPAGSHLRFEVLRRGQPLALAIEPEGEPLPASESARWLDELREGFERGGVELRRHLEEMRQQLEELDRRLRQRPLTDPDVQAV